MKNNRLHGLYAITDSQLIPDKQLNHSIKLALQGGARIIQYRNKSDDTEKRLRQSRSLRSLCDDFGALLIINDDIELATQANADGVHLGKDDISINDARAIAGDRLIIGQSCYDDIELALQAQTQGADYVAFGAFFSSPTKPDARVATPALLHQAKTDIHIPVCAIGGINPGNAKLLIDAGADMIAVISGIFSQPSIRQASQDLSNLF